MEPKSVAPGRLLIVDDNEPYLSLVCAELADLGYPIESVMTGAAASEKIQSQRYSAVLMDYFLEDGTGIDVLRNLPVEAVKNIRILLVTATPPESRMWRDAQKCLADVQSQRPELAGIKLLSKPAELPIMKTLIAALLQ